MNNLLSNYFEFQHKKKTKNKKQKTKKKKCTYICSYKLYVNC